MTYCKNYCEEKGISTSKLNEAQKTLYYIAENMKMDKSISEEGYEYFQQAIKALEQESCDDCISREDVIQLAKEADVDLRYADGVFEFLSLVKDLPSVQPKLIECEDCISRQAVLEVIEREQFKGDAISEIEKLQPVQPYNTDEWCTDCREYDQDKHCCPRYNKVIRSAVEEIKQPKTGQWIPVSERLPNDEDYVLVCYEDGHIRTAYYYIDTNIYPSEFEDCCETGWYNYNEDFMYEQDVIAWMPLPKPYKAESEES